MQAKELLLAVALVCFLAGEWSAAQTSLPVGGAQCYSAWTLHRGSFDLSPSSFNATQEGLDGLCATKQRPSPTQTMVTDGQHLITLEDIVKVARMTERFVETPNFKDQEFTAAVAGKLVDLVKARLDNGMTSEQLSYAASAVVDAVAALMRGPLMKEDPPNLIEHKTGITNLSQPEKEQHQANRELQERQSEEELRTMKRDTAGVLLDKVDELSYALLQNKAEMGYMEMGTKGLQIVVGKSSGSDIGGTTVGVDKGGVTLPSTAALFGDSVPDVARLKVVGFQESPFVWATSAAPLGSSVVNVDLYDSTGETIPVQNLPEDIRITVKNNLPPPDGSSLIPYAPSDDSTMVFRSFDLSANESYLVTVAVRAPLQNVTLYGSLGDYPTETDYDFRKSFRRDDFDSVRPGEDGDVVYTASTVLQPDLTYGIGQYKIGLRLEDCDPTTCQYKIETFHLGCRFWDDQKEVWASDGCKVSPESTAQQTVCLCNHLTAFGAEIVTTANVIRFETVFDKFVELKDNFAVFTTVFTVLGLYILLLLLVRRWDKQDLSKWSVREIPIALDSEANASRYLMTVHTGHDWEAGTKSRVSFTLYGEQGDSGVMDLPQNDRTFERGGTDNFLLKTTEPIGDLLSIKMSHDNSGEGLHASWFLDKVVVTHLETNKRTTFMCDDWLDEEYSGGKFSRTLHAENVMDLSFGRTFRTAIRVKFTDGHLWISVGTRRPRSYFTRVQRLSCCLCLLYCKMIASAMWYRNAAPSSSLFTIGPLSITTQQLWVSMITTLQVFPVNFAIVQIFRRCRPKEAEDAAEENPKSAKYQVRKKWRSSMMPHWFIYIAWALLVLTSLASAFFLILYSLEWGRDKSIKWLVAFGLSFCNSMFIIHPGKAIFIVLLMTILCRRRASQGPTDMMMDELIFTTGGSPEESTEAPRTEATRPTATPSNAFAAAKKPSASDVAKERKRRQKRDKLMHFGKQFVAYIMYIVFALFVVNESWDSMSYQAHNDFRTHLVNGYDNVLKREDILVWMKTGLVDNLFPTTEYNDWTIDWEDRVFISSSQAYRLGPVRIQQWRAETENCAVTKPALIHRRKRCLLSQHNSFRHDGNFFKDVNSSALYRATTAHARGGYTVDLGEDSAQMKSVLTAMIKDHWLDRLTSTVQVDISLYNVDASLFHSLTLLYEFLPTGDAKASFFANSFKMINSQSVYAAVVFLSKVGFVGCVIYLVFNLSKTARKEGKAFFTHHDNLLESASLVASVLVIILDVVKVVLTKQTEGRIYQQRNDVERSFVDLADAANVNEHFVNAVAALVCFTVLRMCRFLDQISARLEFFSDNAHIWLGKIVAYLIIFLTVVAGYSLSGTLLFSPYAKGYKSLPDSSASLLLMFWKKNDVDWFGMKTGILGPMYIFSFSAAMMFLVFNITASVILGTVAMMREERAGKPKRKKKRVSKYKTGPPVGSGKWVMYLPTPKDTVPTYESEV